MTATFRRAPELERRNDLIEATLDCIADLGIQSTTVRAVAARAGVSNGLIRHHFSSKENLIVAAYRRTFEILTRPAHEALESTEETPHRRLARFVAASIGGSAADGRMLSLWASFISQIRVSESIAEVHDDGYLGLRRSLEPLVGEVLTADGKPIDADKLERLGIALNALLDGLWLEGCLEPKSGEKRRIDVGLRSVEALLGVRLPDPA